MARSLRTVLITDWAVSYVHGIMDGEVIADIAQGKDEAEFRLR